MPSLAVVGPSKPCGPRQRRRCPQCCTRRSAPPWLHSAALGMSKGPGTTTWMTGWDVVSGSPDASCASSSSFSWGRNKFLPLLGIPDRNCTKTQPERRLGREGRRCKKKVGFWPAAWSKPRKGGATNRDYKARSGKGSEARERGEGLDGVISYSGNPRCGPLLPWILTCHLPPQSGVEPFRG